MSKAWPSLTLRFIPIAMILAVPFFLSACLPIPHNDLVAPAVSGVLVQDGKPIQGAKVEVKTQNQVRTGITAPKGTFSIKPIHEWYFLMRFMGERMYNYSVFITVDGKTYKAYWQSDFGFAPNEAKLFCSLPQPTFKGMNCRPTPKNVQDDYRFQRWPANPTN